MYVKRVTVDITTDSDGDGTGYSEVINGRILEIRYVKTDFADGVDFDVTLERSGDVVWSEDDINASTSRAPRQATHGTDGAALAYADAGEPVTDFVYAADDRIKIVVASGGDTKSGSFEILVG